MYVGDYRNSKRNGEGKFVYTNGNIYIGSWKNDMRHGHGVLKFANSGDVYEGLWKHDKMDEIGALRFTMARATRMSDAGSFFFDAQDSELDLGVQHADHTTTANGNVDGEGRNESSNALGAPRFDMNVEIKKVWAGQMTGKYGKHSQRMAMKMSTILGGSAGMIGGGGGMGGVGGGGMGVGAMGAMGSLMFGDDPDSRPSISTMERQWEFMRSHFINNADEELEWLMVSKKKGAFKYANKKNEDAEDRYFKALFDTDNLKNKLNVLIDDRIPIRKVVAKLVKLHKDAKDAPLSEAAVIQVETLQKEMQTLLAKDDILAVYSKSIAIEFEALVDMTLEKQVIVENAVDLVAHIQEEVKLIKSQVQKVSVSGDEALTDMEKWAKRQKEADEYIVSMRKEESDWFENEHEKNMEALRTMRTYIPINIADLSVNELTELARAQGGLGHLGRRR